MIFIGEYYVRADAKSRVAMPSSFKKILDEATEARVVVRKDVFERCLLVTPYGEWQAEMEQMHGRLNPFNREHMQFLREFQRNSVEITIDSAGRFLVPRRFMEMISAEKDLVLLGVDRHIELWDQSTYESSSLDAETFSRLATKTFEV